MVSIDGWVQLGLLSKSCLENVSDPNVAQAGKFLETLCEGAGVK
jgi:hypothetical protein